VISTEFEERLREEMRHATTGVSAPSGLVRRARRARRRRIVSRASAASAAAAVAVAGAVIVSNGTTGASRDSGAYTTAYVVTHVDSALDAVNKIAYMHFTSPALAPMDVWAYDGPQGQASRAEYFSPLGGQFFQEVGMTATPTNYQTYILVDPIHKTWSKQSYQGPKPSERGCGFSQPAGWGTFPEIAAGLRKDLACGALSSEGMQQVDGVNALKLISVQRSRFGPKTLGTITTIIWVDPATYLPVRLTTQWTRPMVSVPMRYDFRWLPPTSANLALLTVRIPPGFTQVHIHCTKTGCITV
jgi:hypothetical protein